MMRLKNRIAFVTGAGAGIGRATAERFAAEGATVIAADINEAGAKETVQRIAAAGGKASAVALDVADPKAVAAAFAAVEREHGRLDALVANAGITDRLPFLDMPLDKFERILRVNLIGTMLCGQAAARLMKKGGGGRIVNMSSVSGQQGGTGRAAYGASKAAIINLTQTMALELAEHNILVNVIAPGPTQVARTAHGPAQKKAFLDRMALKRYATPGEIAAAALFLCSEDATFVTGHVLNVDGGLAGAGVIYDPAKGEL
jgi:3-oxoacyl-[acyl-carrier protein] reductase